MLQLRTFAFTLFAGWVLAASADALAAPSLDIVLDGRLAERLRGRTQPASSPKLLPGTAVPYAVAVKALGQGEPVRTLEALKGTRFGLLADREALVRADALSALGDHRGALAAYLTALDKAEILDVGLSAARGLRKTLRVLGNREAELKVIDALLDVRNVDYRPQLLMTRAEALVAVNRKQEGAAQAWRLLQAFPAADVADAAKALVDRLRAAKVPIPPADGRTELARIRNLIQAGAVDEAERALASVSEKHPSLAREALMVRLALLEKQNKRDDERRILASLRKTGLDNQDGPTVLFRLARLAMADDDNPQAIAYFDELAERFPDSPHTREGQYLAAWLPYNSGDHLETHKRMMAFSRSYPKADLRTQALWFAGWSAYLAAQPKLAEAAWTQLIDDHPTSELVPHGGYWLARLSHQRGQLDEARERYRKVLHTAPMSYYGFLARARLTDLGEPSELGLPPPAPPTPSVNEFVGRLGRKRPRLVDRAIVLHAAGLQAEAAAELRAATKSLWSVRDTEGRTIVAGMLHQLGAHYLAFRLASRVTRAGDELETGEAWAWQAWRQAYPEAFQTEVDAAHEAHEVENNLVWAVMRTESSYRPWIRSPVGARGLMQLMPKTARAIGKVAEGGRRHARRYVTPQSNVWLGTWYLKKLGERYDGQLAAMAAAYNAGPVAMDRWLRELGGTPLDEFVERIPYKETRRYTRRVIETYLVYRRMKGLPLPKLPQILAKIEPSGGVTF